MNKEKMLQWKQLITMCEKSGLPVKHWCRENQVSVSCYYKWKNLLFPNGNTATEETVFAKVPFVTVQEALPVISLDIKWKEMQLRISSREEADLAAYLIGRLQSPC